MTHSEIIAEIGRLVAAARQDKDGGYGLSRAVDAWYRSLTGEDARSLRGILLDVVRAEDPVLSGVALDVLESEADPSLPAFLLDRLNATPSPSDSQCDDLLLALCRMGKLPATHLGLIDSALESRPPRGVAAAAALVRTDAKASQRILGNFLSRQFLAWTEFEADSYLAPIVIYYSAVDARLLVTLVDVVGVESPAVVGALAAALRRQVLLPFRADLMDAESRHLVIKGFDEWIAKRSSVP